MPPSSQNLLDGYYWESDLAPDLTHFVELVKIPAWKLKDIRVRRQVDKLSQQTKDLLFGDFFYYKHPLIDRRSKYALNLLDFPPTHRIQIGFYPRLKGGKSNNKTLVLEIAVSLTNVLHHPNYASEIGSFLLNRLNDCRGRVGLSRSRENREWFLLCFFAVYGRLINSGVSQLSGF